MNHTYREQERIALDMVLHTLKQEVVQLESFAHRLNEEDCSEISQLDKRVRRLLGVLRHNHQICSI